MADEFSLIDRRDRVFGQGAPLFYDSPLTIVRGEGVYLYDVEGRVYLDLYNNVPCVGHGNPRVADAVYEQQKTFNAHSRYVHESAVRLGERLVALHHSRIECVVFSCSGTEANEVAIRIARIASGRKGLICSDWAYHGNSSLLSQLTHRGSGRRPLNDVASIPVPETYRSPIEGASPDELCKYFLAELDRAIDELDRSGAGLAAFIVCPLFANEGLPNIPEGFWAGAEKRVREAGGLIVADEVQAGYGRTGNWWGYQKAGFKPDIVVTGKPMGNGVPLAATYASRDNVELFRRKTGYFNTFASSPLQSAAGLAVLDEIEESDLLRRVEVCGAFLKEKLRELSGSVGFIGDVRGAGTFIGVEIVDDKAVKTPNEQMAKQIVNQLKTKGHLTSNAGPYKNIIKVRPPLIFEKTHAEQFVREFETVISEAR